MSMNNRLTVGLRKQQYQTEVNNSGCGRKPLCAHNFKHQRLKWCVGRNNFPTEQLLSDFSTSLWELYSDRYTVLAKQFDRLSSLTNKKYLPLPNQLHIFDWTHPEHCKSEK